jgi:hypothetical protein
MSTELQTVCEQILGANRGEDLFGPLQDGPINQKLSALRKKYHQLSRAVHPDQHNGDDIATMAFAHLSTLYNAAVTAVENEVYGRGSSTASGGIATIKTKLHEYSVYDYIRAQGCADVHECVIDGREQGELHIAHLGIDNDLMTNESVMLKKLLDSSDHPGATGYFSMLPQYIESFIYKHLSNQRRANAFRPLQGFVSLDDAIRAHPKGIKAEDMAWIWRRLLDVLGYAHSRGIVHGNVLPPNIMIGLGDIHEVVLVNWQSAVSLETTRVIRAIDPHFRGWYPPEVLSKAVATPATDIYLSAMSMRSMLMGPTSTYVKGILPHVPRKIDGFLMSCCFEGQRSRPQNAWDLRAEFTSLIEEMWGKRSYRPFYMPSSSS